MQKSGNNQREHQENDFYEGWKLLCDYKQGKVFLQMVSPVKKSRNSSRGPAMQTCVLVWISFGAALVDPGRLPVFLHWRRLNIFQNCWRNFSPALRFLSKASGGPGIAGGQYFWWYIRAALQSTVWTRGGIVFPPRPVYLPVRPWSWPVYKLQLHAFAHTVWSAIPASIYQPHFTLCCFIFSPSISAYFCRVQW